MSMIQTLDEMAVRISYVLDDNGLGAYDEYLPTVSTEYLEAVKAAPVLVRYFRKSDRFISAVMEHKDGHLTRDELEAKIDALWIAYLEALQSIMTGAHRSMTRDEQRALVRATTDGSDLWAE